MVSLSSGFRPRFFVELPPGAAAPGRVVELKPADARHARVVLRARAGDHCELVVRTVGNGAEGEGRLWEGHFEAQGKELVVSLESELEVPAARLRLLLGQALPLPRAADLIVEKGTEVGVDLFVFFPSRGSPQLNDERIEARVARWRRIAEEAAKQSKQLALPGVEWSCSLLEALDRFAVWGGMAVALDPAASDDLRDLLSEEGLFSPRASHSRSADDQLGQGARIEGGSDGPARLSLIVGPEGGWSEEEKQVMSSRGISRARLGRRILRAETAGPAASAAVRFFLRDW